MRGWRRWESHAAPRGPGTDTQGLPGGGWGSRGGSDRRGGARAGLALGFGALKWGSAPWIKEGGC